MAGDGSDSAPGYLSDHKTVPIFLEHSSVDSYCSDKSTYTIMCPNYIMVGADVNMAIMAHNAPVNVKRK